MHKRPIYIWILGAPSSIKSILSDRIFDHGVMNSYSYNIKYDTSDVIFQILPYRQKGKMLIKPDYQSIVFKEYSKDNDFSFSVGLDLSSLPDYAKKFEFLITKKNLVLEPEYLCGKIFIKTIDDAKKDPKYNSIAEKMNLNITHLLTLTLPRLQESSQTYTILIKQGDPNWIQESHSPDDCICTINSLEGKTFGLNAITEAFKQASDTVTPLLQIPIRIIK